MNHVTLIGRLVATTELRQTGSGKSVTTAPVATNGKSHAEFHDMVVWGQLASFACSYLGKGRLVYIEGRPQSRQWQTTDGSTRRTAEIVANRLQALSSKSTTAAFPPGLVPEGVLTQSSRGWQTRSATNVLGFGAFQDCTKPQGVKAVRAAASLWYSRGTASLSLDYQLPLRVLLHS